MELGHGLLRRLKLHPPRHDLETRRVESGRTPDVRSREPNAAGHVEGADVEGQVLTPAQPAATALSYRNQWARLTFAGSIGDNLGMEVNGVTLGGSGNIVVLRPDGGQLNALSFVSSSDYSVRLTQLAQAGTYTVLVQPSSNLTGSIQLTLWKDAQPGTFELETPKTVALAYRNQWARMTFNGTAGENLGAATSEQVASNATPRNAEAGRPQVATASRTAVPTADQISVASCSAWSCSGRCTANGALAPDNMWPCRSNTPARALVDPTSTASNRVFADAVPVAGMGNRVRP